MCVPLSRACASDGRRREAVTLAGAAHEFLDVDALLRQQPQSLNLCRGGTTRHQRGRPGDFTHLCPRKRVLAMQAAAQVRFVLAVVVAFAFICLAVLLVRMLAVLVLPACGKGTASELRGRRARARTKNAISEARPGYVDHLGHLPDGAAARALVGPLERALGCDRARQQNALLHRLQVSKRAPARPRPRTRRWQTMMCGLMALLGRWGARPSCAYASSMRSRSANSVRRSTRKVLERLKVLLKLCTHRRRVKGCRVQLRAPTPERSWPRGSTAPAAGSRTPSPGGTCQQVGGSADTH
jgi:hypothetical protein